MEEVDRVGGSKAKGVRAGGKEGGKSQTERKEGWWQKKTRRWRY
jgi:hypothetical protein